MDYKQNSWDIQIGSLSINAVDKKQEMNISALNGLIAKFSETELKKIAVIKKSENKLGRTYKLKHQLIQAMLRHLGRGNTSCSRICSPI